MFGFHVPIGAVGRTVRHKVHSIDEGAALTSSLGAGTSGPGCAKGGDLSHAIDRLVCQSAECNYFGSPGLPSVGEGRQQFDRLCSDVAKIVPGWGIRLEDVRSISTFIRAAQTYTTLKDRTENSVYPETSPTVLIPLTVLELRLGRIVSLAISSILKQNNISPTEVILADTLVSEVGERNNSSLVGGTIAARFQALVLEIREKGLGTILKKAESPEDLRERKITIAEHNYGTCLLAVRLVLPLFITNEHLFGIWNASFNRTCDVFRTADPTQGLRIGAGPNQFFILAVRSVIAMSAHLFYCESLALAGKDHIQLYRRAKIVLNRIAPLGDANWDKIIADIVAEERVKIALNGAALKNQPK